VVLGVGALPNPKEISLQLKPSLFYDMLQVVIIYFQLEERVGFVAHQPIYWR
jgi:hypothetical protein